MISFLVSRDVILASRALISASSSFTAASFSAFFRRAMVSSDMLRMRSRDPSLSIATSNAISNNFCSSPAVLSCLLTKTPPSLSSCAGDMISDNTLRFWRRRLHRSSASTLLSCAFLISNLEVLTVSSMPRVRSPSISQNSASNSSIRLISLLGI
ncbi:hypothetical protein F4803DRAFT_528681 [Xylaria telfairii]|nr:hypothetical protein F4803DRAFT_528681 [Xylaria telfairii]